MREGIDPSEEKRKELDECNRKRLEEEQANITLRQVLDTMLSVRKNRLKPRTIQTYKQLFDLYLPDWLDLPIRKLTKKAVEERFSKITESGTMAAANNCFRTFRLVWNFGNTYFENVLGENPVRQLSGLKLWNRVNPRKREIPQNKLFTWYKTVSELENPIMRDFLLFLLFTGLRRNEAAKLKWKEVNLETRAFTIRDTKNQTPLELPISSFVLELLHRRLSLRENDFVFPGNGVAGHIEEPKRAIKLVMTEIGVDFSCHDLRRTFTSIGAAELLIHPFLLDALTNHTPASKKDMTRDYTVIAVQRLRTPAQQICDYLMAECGIKEPANVVKLVSRRAAS